MSDYKYQPGPHNYKLVIHIEVDIHSPYGTLHPESLAEIYDHAVGIVCSEIEGQWQCDALSLHGWHKYEDVTCQLSKSDTSMTQTDQAEDSVEPGE